MHLHLDPATINPSQLRFLESRSRYVCFAGGFGSGKTSVLALKILQLVAANPGMPGLVVAQSFGALFSTVIATLHKILRASIPEDQLPTVRGGTMRPHSIFWNGSTVHWRSAENPGGYDGLDVAWVCGDEIRHWSKEAYDIAIARARMRAAPMLQRAFTSTPSMGWMYDEFGSGRSGRELITCGTAENARNLEPEYIDGLRAAYSSRLQRAVIEGEFTMLEGAVYEAFDPNPSKSPWVIDYAPSKDRLSNKRVLLAVDPGYRRSAWLWIAEEAPLEWVVFDQLMPDNTTDVAAVEQVNARGYYPDEIWTDPAADNTQSATGADTLAALRMIKVRGINRRPLRTVADYGRDIAFGVDKTRVLLGGEHGQPIRIKFARALARAEQGRPRGIVRDLGALRYPEIKDGRAVTDKPLKDGVTDHSTDAFRYFAVGQWMSRTELRSKDPVLSRMTSQGWRATA
jgi:hypothetical protein